MEIENTPLPCEQQLELLEEERQKLEIQEQYIEVDVLTKKIAVMKEKLKKQQLDQLKSIQSNERDLLEKNCQAEQLAFNKNWELIIDAYLQKCSVELEEFNKKHRQDIIFEKTRLENTLHMFFKPSAALLNMITCKEKAVKAGKYIDAQILRDQIEVSKVAEESRFIEHKRSAVEQGLINFEQAYEKKLINLKKRHQSGLNELEIQRIAENIVLNKKFDNLKRDMENLQQITVNIQGGRHKTAVGRQRQSPNKSSVSMNTSSPFSKKHSIPYDS